MCGTRIPTRTVSVIDTTSKNICYLVGRSTILLTSAHQFIVRPTKLKKDFRTLGVPYYHKLHTTSLVPLMTRLKYYVLKHYVSPIQIYARYITPILTAGNNIESVPNLLVRTVETLCFYDVHNSNRSKTHFDYNIENSIQQKTSTPIMIICASW